MLTPTVALRDFNIKTLLQFINHSGEDSTFLLVSIIWSQNRPLIYLPIAGFKRFVTVYEGK